MALIERVEDDLTLSIDGELLDRVMPLVSGWFPDADELHDAGEKMTSENMVAIAAEHGRWLAFEIGFDPRTGLPDGLVHEIGCVLSWRSDSGPGGCPCYEAALMVASPPPPESRWPVYQLDRVASACAPDDGDGQLAATRAWAALEELVFG